MKKQSFFAKWFGRRRKKRISESDISRYLNDNKKRGKKAVGKFIAVNNAIGGKDGVGSFSLGSVNRDPKTLNVKNPAVPVVSGGGKVGKDNFEEPPIDFDVLYKAITADSYASEALLKHKELIFKNGYSLSWTNEQSYLYLKSRIAYMEVATRLPFNNLLQYIANDLVDYGNAFVVKARAKKGVGIPPGLPATPILPSKEPIAGYFLMNPIYVTIARDEDGSPAIYKQEVEGADPIEFKAEDVIHFTLNRATGHAFAIPYYAAVLDDIRLLRKIEENVAILLYKHIFPMLTYTVGIAERPELHATEEEIDEAKETVENLTYDGVFVLPERHKIEAIKIETIEIEPFLQYFENRVFTGLNTSSIEMGRGDTANRNTADAMGDQKSDRIKGWQRQLAEQIDHFIINELLVEGGFDPLINSEFDVDFTFKEIENEKLMAMENHTTQLFTNNLVSFEEARLAIGRDPVVDESRLYVNMIGLAKAENNAVDNKSQPENQHGKKKSNEQVEHQESESSTTNEHILLDGLIKSMLDDIRAYANEQINGKIKNDRFGLPTHLARSKFKTLARVFSSECITEGQHMFLSHINENISCNVYRNNEFIETIHTEWFDSLIEDISSDLKAIIHSEASSLDKLAMVSVKVERYQKRYETHIATIKERLKNYGFYLSASYNLYQIDATTESSACFKCKAAAEKVRSLLELKQDESYTLKEYKEKAAFYLMPPFHPSCGCSVSITQ